VAFLLSTEALFAILRPEPESHPVIRWKRSVPNRLVFISVISLGEAVDAVNHQGLSGRVRSQWERRLREHIPVIFHQRTLGISERIAREWGKFRHVLLDEEDCPLPTEEALILATARVEGYSYVGKGKLYHEKIGIHIVDPDILVNTS
jgi:predicted nucleic acid-binding protein